MSKQLTTEESQSSIDLVVEVRGIEQGTRPVSASFAGISVNVANSGLITFQGPYEILSLPGSKGIDMAVEAPIFVGLISTIFGPAEGLYGSYEKGRVPSIWELARFEITSTATTRFFGYKPGSKRQQVQVGLSQVTSMMRGSSLGATSISTNLHVWNPPDFALSFQQAKVALRPLGYGRLGLNAEYSWNGGEWTAKTNGLLLLDGNQLIKAREGSKLNTVLTLELQEKQSDNSEGLLSGKLNGKITRQG